MLLNYIYFCGQASSHPDWNNIPDMWPDLETLHIRQGKGLTMGTVSNLIPRLEKLKEICFPKRIMVEEPYELLSKSRPLPIQFFFRWRDYHSGGKCPFLASEEENPYIDGSENMVGYGYQYMVYDNLEENYDDGLDPLHDWNDYEDD